MNQTKTTENIDFMNSPLTTPGLIAVESAIQQMGQELDVLISPLTFSVELAASPEDIIVPVNYFALAPIEASTSELELNEYLSQLRVKVASELTWLNVCEPLLYQDDMRIVTKQKIFAGRLGLTERVAEFSDSSLIDDKLKTIVDIFPDSQTALKGSYKNRQVEFANIFKEIKLRRSAKKGNTD